MSLQYYHFSSTIPYLRPHSLSVCKFPNGRVKWKRKMKEENGRGKWKRKMKEENERGKSKDIL